MSPGTAGGGGVTRVGDGSLFMVHTHVGHDCIVGDGVILANCATLAGHVTVGDGVVLGGLAAVHQFVRLGRGAMIGGLAGVVADVIPFGTVAGERATLIGLNLVGLKRRQVERRTLAEFRAAFAEIARGSGPFVERVRGAGARHAANPFVREVVDFVTTETARSFTVPPPRGDG
jgi:UDP-N-acetylglucosamine acyltransferase